MSTIEYRPENAAATIADRNAVTARRVCRFNETGLMLLMALHQADEEEFNKSSIPRLTHVSCLISSGSISVQNNAVAEHTFAVATQATDSCMSA